jgi:hypothetical protein
MPYYVKMRRNGRLCGKLGPFSTQKLAVKQAQPLADDAADDVVVTVEPAATSNPKPKKTNTRKTRKKTGMTWRLVRGKDHQFAPITSRWVRGDQRVWGASEDSMLYRERFPTKKEAKAFVSRVKRAPGTWMVRAPEDSGQRFHVYPNGVGVGGWLVVYIADHEVSSRRRNYSPVPGSPPLASATDSLVDWSPMNARTARSMERMGMAPRKKNSRRRNVYSMKVGSYYMASCSAKTIAVMDDPGVRGHGKAKQMSVTKQDMSIYHPVAFADMPAFVQAAFRKKNSRRRNTSMPRGRAGTVRQGTLKLGK